MARDTGYHEYIVGEILKNIPGIISKTMFGGWGIYKDGVFFALIADSQLYFKVDDSNQKDYEKFGSEPFIYKTKKGPMKMSYWLLPEEIMSDSKRLAEWIDKSVVANINSKKKK